MTELNAMIVGGSSGLGFSIAKKLCLRGYKISIVGKNVNKLRKVQNYINKKYKKK